MPHRRCQRVAINGECKRKENEWEKISKIMFVGKKCFKNGKFENIFQKYLLQISSNRI